MLTPAALESDLDWLRHLVRTRSAIVLDEGKDYLIESRLMPVARTAGFATLGDFLTAARHPASAALRDRAVEAMTTNETSFFRDAKPFDALRDAILPELLMRRSATRSLTVWSAACSTGQEPYSLAMLLHDRFPELASWQVRILGTDLSTAVLDRARSGRYSQLEVNRGLPAPYLLRYFARDGAGWQLSAPIRDAVEFQPLNLIESWPSLPPLDIVLLRNVLIYFDVDVKRRILARVRGLLRPDGYLFLGGAETTLNLDDTFERAPFDHASCYRLKSSPIRS